MIQKKSCDQSIIINIYINKDYKASLQEPLILSSPLVKKANRRLYVLRQLKKCKVPSADIVHIYCALIRSILEYASAVFAGLPKYLACYIKNVQKRALSIIWPGISYETALDKAALSTLSDRRTVSCIKFIGKVRPGNPLYPLIHNRVVPISTSVCLRSGSSSRPMATRTERFSTFASVKCNNNKCSVLGCISQLVRYPTIQSSDCKGDNKPVIRFDLIWFYNLQQLAARTASLEMT